MTHPLLADDAACWVLWQEIAMPAWRFDNGTEFAAIAGPARLQRMGANRLRRFVEDMDHGKPDLCLVEGGLERLREALGMEAK
jgi:hypothetical protein